MDNLQKAGLKLVVLGLGALGVSFGLSLASDHLSHSLGLRSIGTTFISTLFTLAGLCFVRFGDKTEAMLGPAGSDQRKQRIYVCLVLFCVPALALSVAHYFLLANRGYHL